MLLQLRVEEVFHAADYNRTNVLDLIQARHAVKMLLPSITDQEMRYVMAHLYYQVIPDRIEIGSRQRPRENYC